MQMSLIRDVIWDYCFEITFKLQFKPHKIVLQLHCPTHWSHVLFENEDVFGAAPTGDAPTTNQESKVCIAY